MANLSNCNRTMGLTKIKNINSLALYRKSLPPCSSPSLFPLCNNFRGHTWIFWAHNIKEVWILLHVTACNKAHLTPIGLYVSEKLLCDATENLGLSVSTTSITFPERPKGHHEHTCVLLVNHSDSLNMQTGDISLYNGITPNIFLINACDSTLTLIIFNCTGSKLAGDARKDLCVLCLCKSKNFCCFRLK